MNKHIPRQKLKKNKCLHNDVRSIWLAMASFVMGFTFQVGCSFSPEKNKKSQEDASPKPAQTSNSSPERTGQNSSNTDSQDPVAPVSIDLTPKLSSSLDELLAKVKKLELSGSKAGSHTPTTYGNPEEIALEKKFVESFLQHNYGNIENLQIQFKEYANRNPNSSFALGRLAYLNLWKWNERYALEEVPINITKSIAECLTYFDKSLPLAPKQMVYRAFGTNCKLLSGLVSQNIDLLVEANQHAAEAIVGLSEYAPFSLSYPFLVAPADSKRFQVGTALLMRLLDVCMGRDIDRDNPDLRPFFADLLKKTTPYNSYCLNTYVAPHNREGIYLTVGDILVKAGKLDAAKVMYENIKASPGFPSWPFKGLVEERIKNPEKFQKDFNITLNGLKKPSHEIMAIAGEFSCSICHMSSSVEKDLILNNFDMVVAEKKTISGYLMPNQSP